MYTEPYDNTIFCDYLLPYISLHTQNKLAYTVRINGSSTVAPVLAEIKF